MKSRYLKIYTLLFVCFFITGCCATKTSPLTTPRYQVLRVIDGDTFIASDGHIQFKVRIAGIDAPEKAQAYGKVSKQVLNNWLMNQSVELRPLKKPLGPYNRVLAQVFLNQEDIGLKLVQNGLAFYYRPTCKDYPIDKKKYNYDPSFYIQAENSAQKTKQNIWSQATAKNPCDFRKSKSK